MPKSDSGKTDFYLADNIEFSLDTSTFESTTLTIKVRNTTTQTEVKKTSSIQLIELLERGVILEIPAKSCSRGHNLVVKFKAVTPHDESIEFDTTAKVEAAESQTGEDIDQLTLTFLQYDEESWERFQGYFSARQAEILEFLQSAKGY